jgi:peptidoglycan/xylan/chitin deacetylase (PgdA/CDA1 family)
MKSGLVLIGIILVLIPVACSPAQSKPFEDIQQQSLTTATVGIALATATPSPTPSPTISPTPEPLWSVLPAGELVSRIPVYDSNLVALTIDDGYGRIPFDAITLVLNERDLHATYFLVAQAAINLGGERISQLVEDGHQIAYHSFSHDELEELASWDSEAWIADFEEWQMAFIELLGPDAFNRAFRPYARAPYGLFNVPFLDMTQELGLIPIGWSRAPDDLNRGISMQNGDIFLFHVRFPDAEIMGPIIDNAEYDFVTLDELIASSTLLD